MLEKHPMSRPPLPGSDRRWALFLDLDGTLVELVDHPDAIELNTAARTRLEALSQRLDGALALISGRAMEDLDRHVQLPGLAMSGQHGAEWRESGGEPRVASAHQQALDSLRNRLQPLLERHEALMLENKGASLALHYRQNPELGDVIAPELERLVSEHTSVLEMHHGKFVYEIKGTGYDKGVAIERFMALPLFHGRIPVFIGDDRTDEDGFRAIGAHDGIAIKVGDGDTSAPWRLEGPAEVHRWLSEWLEQLKR